MTTWAKVLLWYQQNKDKLKALYAKNKTAVLIAGFLLVIPVFVFGLYRYGVQLWDLMRP